MLCDPLGICVLQNVHVNYLIVVHVYLHGRFSKPTHVYGERKLGGGYVIYAEMLHI